MLTGTFYIIFILFEILILVAMTFYATSMLLSWVKGAPYVPTQQKEILEILSKAELKPNQNFLELGCGDGRVTQLAVRNWHVKGRGVDINPLLIVWARIKAKIQNLQNIEFSMQDVHKTDFSQADVIYIFLFPKLVESLKEKILTETKKNTLIISHGFKIDFLEKFLVTSRKGSKFTTYYYKLSHN